MRVLQKLIAFIVYGALLLPISQPNRLMAWMKAVEVSSTCFDRTMRRRRSQVDGDRYARFMRLWALASDDRDEKTLRVRCA